MTDSWLALDSPIAEPVRLEGPDDFDHPDAVSILEFGDFVPRRRALRPGRVRHPCLLCQPNPTRRHCRPAPGGRNAAPLWKKSPAAVLHFLGGGGGGGGGGVRRVRAAVSERSGRDGCTTHVLFTRVLCAYVFPALLLRELQVMSLNALLVVPLMDTLYYYYY
jgi:hypothetical protein